MTGSSGPARLGVPSGVALVVSNMVGAGVFLSAGFMSQEMGPGPLLLAWVVGAVIALAGTRAYAQAAEWVPRSGGEYRYLSDLLHPALGYLAGWASLLVGFSAPIAVNALAAGAFVGTLVPGIDARAVAGVIIVALTLFHALRLGTSKWVHNAIVIVDVLLLVGFVVTGLALGDNRWPTWTPPQAAAGFPVQAFAGSLFWIAFAFAGWNAAVYVASDFHRPARDVPRAMAIGCGLVAVLYLLVNWVFVANLTPDDGRAVFDYDTRRVTLGHVVAEKLLGPFGGAAVSALVITALVAAASAMTVVGPRVYAAMADDGFLPRPLRAAAGRPPTGSVLLQSALALIIAFTHRIHEVLGNVGAVLAFFAALVSCAVIRERFFPAGRSRPSLVTVLCALVHVCSTAWMLYFGLRQPVLLIWIAAVAAVALVAYALTRRSLTSAARAD